MDGSVRFQVLRQASLFSEGRTHERNTLILGGDERTLHIIISTATLEGEDRTIYQILEFIFGEAVSDTDQQLLAGKRQWVYTLNGDRYYLSESKHYYLLAFLQLVTMPRMMKWGMSCCIESVHVGVLTQSSFTKSGPPRNIILHPGNIGCEVPMGEIQPRS